MIKKTIVWLVAAAILVVAQLAEAQFQVPPRPVTRPHVAHHGAATAVPPDAELDKYPLEPEKVDPDWADYFVLTFGKLESDVSLWNYHRETKTWPWETLTAGTGVYFSADGIPRYKADCINRLVLLKDPKPVELPSAPAPTPQAPETRQTQTVGRTNLEVNVAEPPPPPLAPNVKQEQSVGDTTVTVNVPSPPSLPPPSDVRQTQEVGDVHVTVNVGGKKKEETKPRGDKPQKSSFFGPVAPFPTQTQIQRVGERVVEVNIYEPENNWGFTFSGTRFSTNPISGVVEKLTGRDVCDISGLYVDAGVSYGRPRASFWRFVATAKLVDEWSSTQYFCAKCQANVINTSRGMKVWGVAVERVQQFGPSRWSVHPGFTARLGAGVVTGGAERFVWSEVIQESTTFERVGASELFGSKLMLDVGFAPAVIIGLGEHTTLVVEGPGITSPGLHYAKMGLIFRP